jgi:hypothetical protein
MTTAAQKKALVAHRRRAAERGLVRVEVRVPVQDTDLIRSVAACIRENPELAVRIGDVIASRSGEKPAPKTWGTILESLPDVSGPEFDEAFETSREPFELRNVDF